MKRSSIVGWVFVALSIIVLLGGMWMVIQTARNSLEAENTHHAYLQTLEAVTLYLEQHDRHWPSDLESLASFALNHDPQSFYHFKDLTDLQRRVEIRFDLTTEEVVNTDSPEFNALRPREPHFGNDLSRIQRLLQVARGDK